jgi:cell division septation protein DedD
LAIKSLLSLLSLSIVLTGCDNGRRNTGEIEDVSGVALVGGIALDRQGLMMIPRSGDRPELRSLLDPSLILWRGRDTLPASVDARSIGRVVVLRTAEGSVHTFDPDREIVRNVGTIEGEPSWTGSAEGGVFYTSEQILAVTEREARVIQPEGGRILWASPATGSRVVALVEGSDATRVTLWGEDESTPESSVELDVGTPGLVIAWGRELVLSGAQAAELVQVSLPRLEPVERSSLETNPFALAASPSSHKIYAAARDEGTILALDRFTGETREHGRFEAPIQEVRPSVIGDYLLVFDGGTSWALPPGSDEPVALDTEWRSDLPLGLPGGRVVIVRDGSLWVWNGLEGSAAPLEAAADAWWLPVSWAPDRQRMQLASQEEEGGPSAPAAESAAEPLPDETTEEPEPTPGLGGLVPSVAETAEATPVVSVPPGFYAVAASSQRVGGVHDLSEALEGDGYPASVVPRRDEANEIWYRVMVGPYDSRDEAEAVVLRLRRERGIQGWVREVGSDGLSGGVGGAE